MKRLMEYLGLEPGRIKARWISGSEGEKFAQAIREITEEVRALGPNWKLRDQNEYE